MTTVPIGAVVNSPNPAGFHAEQQRLAAQLEAEQEAATSAGKGTEPAPAPARRSDHEIHDDPATQDEITRLAASLIAKFPNDAVPVVVTVEIPSRLRGGVGLGYAEVFKAWPVNSQMAVSKDGKLYAIGDHRPTVALTDAMRWRDPVALHPPEMWRPWVLRSLTRESDERRDTEPQRAVQPHLTGPLSSGAVRKIARLGNERNVIRNRMERIVDLYGTRQAPKEHGRPTRATKKAWAQIEAAERKLAAIDRRRRALGHIDL